MMDQMQKFRDQAWQNWLVRSDLSEVDLPTSARSQIERAYFFQLEVLGLAVDDFVEVTKNELGKLFK